MYALGWEVGKLRDQNRELDKRDRGEGGDSRLRRKSQCHVVSLPPLPLPWLAIERKCLSKYVAHMFYPPPIAYRRHVQWPGRDPRPIGLQSSPSDLAAPQSIPGTHASARWRVCLSAHF